MNKRVSFIFTFQSYSTVLGEEEVILGPQDHTVNYDDNRSFSFTWGTYFLSKQVDPAHEAALKAHKNVTQLEAV